MKAARWVLPRPDRAAAHAVRLAAAPELQESSGLYFEKGRPVEPAPRARDEDTAMLLWELSEKLVGRELP
jgi:hypothetical protein